MKKDILDRLVRQIRLIYITIIWGYFKLNILPNILIGINTKSKLNIMERKEEEINKGELVYTSSPLYYNCTFKAKSI